MSVQVELVRDDISPELRRKLLKLDDLRPVLRAAGTEVQSIAKLAFRNSSMRAKAWSAKRSGEPSNLLQKGTLRDSIRITAIDAKSVTVGSDRAYAAIHQFGGVIKPKAGKYLVFTIGGKKIFAKKVTIPARPFLPFTSDGELIPAAQKKVLAVIKKAAGEFLKL